MGELDFFDNFYFAKIKRGIWKNFRFFFSSNFPLFDAEKRLKQLKT